MIQASIQKHLALSLQQFSKATEKTSQVFETVSAFNKLLGLPIHHQNHKNTPKNMSIFNKSFWKAVMVRAKHFRI